MVSKVSRVLSFSALTLLAIPASGADIHWLRNDHLEAGFTWTESIRLSVLRVPGGENLLRETNDPYHGLKTWVMAPSDLGALRDMVSEEPGSVEVVDEHSIRISTIAPNVWGLRLAWEVKMDPVRAELIITQRIINEGKEHRYLGVWSIAAFAPGTTFRIPFTRSAAVPRGYPNAIGVFPFTDLADGRISSTEEYLQMEVRRGEESGSVKIGVVEPEGRILVERAGITLEMTSPYLPDAIYPEGGWNLTLYSSPANQRTTMGEAEHVGPLQLLGSGESAELRLTIRLGE